MIYLPDTNVITRFAIRSDPAHILVRNAIRKLNAQGHTFSVSPQSCIEAWNVGTRPAAKNGFGLSLAEANQMLKIVERVFTILPDNAMIYPEWRRLVVAYGVSGVQVHDTRLVAIMNVNAITHILTFNTKDFTRFAPDGIVAVDPATV